jgi:8-oxo-dGTP diphosphatase
MIIQEEFLFTVDDSNRPIEPRSRTEVHASGCWHRTTHIWIVNDRQQILCQKRSMLKDTNPGKWECFFGGHLTAGQDYQSGAIIELREELGIIVGRDDLIFFRIFKSDAAKEFQGIFLLSWDGDSKALHLEKEEVDQVKWVDRSILESVLVASPTAFWTLWAYQARLLKALKTSRITGIRPSRCAEILEGSRRSRDGGTNSLPSKYH